MRSAILPTVKSLNAISAGVAAVVFEMEKNRLLANLCEGVVGAGDIPFNREKVRPGTNCFEPATPVEGFSVFSKENVGLDTNCFEPAIPADGFTAFNSENVKPDTNCFEPAAPARDLVY